MSDKNPRRRGDRSGAPREGERRSRRRSDASQATAVTEEDRHSPLPEVEDLDEAAKRMDMSRPEPISTGNVESTDSGTDDPNQPLTPSRPPPKSRTKLPEVNAAEAKAGIQKNLRKKKKEMGLRDSTIFDEEGSEKGSVAPPSERSDRAAEGVFGESDLEEEPKLLPKSKKGKKKPQTEDESDQLENGESESAPPQPDDELPPQENDDENDAESPKPKKGKKKEKRRKRRQEEENDEGAREEEDQRGDRDVLAVTIHECEDLEPDSMVVHPFIKVHVIDTETGELLKRPASSKQRTDLVLPIQTKPYDLRSKKSLSARWEEELGFDIDSSLCFQPRVVLLFELLDFGPTASVATAGVNRRTRLMESPDALYRVAWGFLRPIRANGTSLVNQRVRIRLFQYPNPMTMPFRRAWSFVKDPLAATRLRSAMEPRRPSVLLPFLFGYREPYPPTLLVTLAAKPRSQAIYRDPKEGNLIPFTTLQEQMAAKQQKKNELSASLMLGEKVDANAQEENKEEVPNEPNPMEVAHDKRQRARNERCALPDTLLYTLETGKRGCLCLKFSPDGNLLACGCCEPLMHPINVYTVATGALAFSLPGHLSVIYEVCFSEDGELLASCSSDTTAKVWSLSNRSLICSLQHPSYVYSAQFHPAAAGPRLVVTGCYDHMIRVWDAEQGSLVRSITLHSAPVTALTFEKDRVRMYSGDSNGDVKIFTARDLDFQCIRTIESKEMSSGVTCVRPLGSTKLFVQTKDNLIRLFDLMTGTNTNQLSGARCMHSVRFSTAPEGSFCISGSDNGRIHIWDHTFKPVPTHTLDASILGNRPIYEVAWSRTHHEIAVCVFGPGGGPSVAVFAYNRKSVAHEAELEALSDHITNVIDQSRNPPRPASVNFGRPPAPPPRPVSQSTRPPPPPMAGTSPPAASASTNYVPPERSPASSGVPPPPPLPTDPDDDKMKRLDEIMENFKSTIRKRTKPDLPPIPNRPLPQLPTETNAKSLDEQLFESEMN